MSIQRHLQAQGDSLAGNEDPATTAEEFHDAADMLSVAGKLSYTLDLPLLLETSLWV